MKYSVVIFLLVILAKNSLAYSETVTLGQRQPGEQLLGFVTNSTQYSPQPGHHEITLTLGAPAGSFVTFVHINIYPDFDIVSFPVHIPYNANIVIQNYATTHLSANAYYYGFAAESPEALAKRDSIEEKTYS
uniref:Secreted protein n=2 Tax=Lutzomyia longipalpis TaxID=7200 RepID=A0A1B0CQF1_LUTLO